jgi:DNA-binding MarR family transcriptional regulator
MTSVYYDLKASLGYQLTVCSRINERDFEAELHRLDLTRVSWCVLLATEQGITAPSSIAAFIGIERTAASRSLNRLETAGFVSRKFADGDRRKTVVQATKAGVSVLERANTCARENSARFISKLDDTELVTFKTLLTKLMTGEDRRISNL